MIVSVSSFFFPVMIAVAGISVLTAGPEKETVPSVLSVFCQVMSSVRSVLSLSEKIKINYLNDLPRST